MDPELTAFKTMFDYKLEPEVYNFHLLDALIKAAEKEGITNFPIHVKLDTGMHRLGFEEKDIPQLIRRLKNQNALIPRSVFSHFVGSDSAQFDAFTRQQIERYEKMSKELQDAFPHKILRHICNTAVSNASPVHSSTWFVLASDCMESVRSITQSSTT